MEAMATCTELMSWAGSQTHEQHRTSGQFKKKCHGNVDFMSKKISARLHFSMRMANSITNGKLTGLQYDVTPNFLLKACF